MNYKRLGYQLRKQAGIGDSLKKALQARLKYGRRQVPDIRQEANAKTTASKIGVNASRSLNELEKGPITSNQLATPQNAYFAEAYTHPGRMKMYQGKQSYGMYPYGSDKQKGMTANLQEQVDTMLKQLPGLNRSHGRPGYNHRDHTFRTIDPAQQKRRPVSVFSSWKPKEQPGKRLINMKADPGVNVHELGHAKNRKDLLANDVIANKHGAYLQDNKDPEWQKKYEEPWQQVERMKDRSPVTDYLKGWADPNPLPNVVYPKVDPNPLQGTAVDSVSQMPNTPKNKRFPWKDGNALEWARAHPEELRMWDELHRQGQFIQAQGTYNSNPRMRLGRDLQGASETASQLAELKGIQNAAVSQGAHPTMAAQNIGKVLGKPELGSGLRYVPDPTDKDYNEKLNMMLKNPASKAFFDQWAARKAAEPIKDPEDVYDEWMKAKKEQLSKGSSFRLGYQLRKQAAGLSVAGDMPTAKNKAMNYPVRNTTPARPWPKSTGKVGPDMLYQTGLMYNTGDPARLASGSSPRNWPMTFKERKDLARRNRATAQGFIDESGASVDWKNTDYGGYYVPRWGGVFGNSIKIRKDEDNPWINRDRPDYNISPMKQPTYDLERDTTNLHEGIHSVDPKLRSGIAGTGIAPTRLNMLQVEVPTVWGTAAETLRNYGRMKNPELDKYYVPGDHIRFDRPLKNLSISDVNQLVKHAPHPGPGYVENWHKLLSSPKATRWAQMKNEKLKDPGALENFKKDHTGTISMYPPRKLFSGNQYYKKTIPYSQEQFEADKADIMRQIQENK